jgi:exoribonuclease-2
MLAPPTTHLLYLHGFRSSPQSAKARQVAARVAAQHPGVTWWCPQLPPSPPWDNPPMYALFEEAGKFLAGRILSEAEASRPGGARQRQAGQGQGRQHLLRFEKPAPAELMAQAQARGQTIELELAWEFAPEDEFGFADLARDYFSGKATLEQQAGALLACTRRRITSAAPARAAFKKAPGRNRAAGAGRHREEKTGAGSRSPSGPSELGQGECPAPIREQLYKILFKPDKNAPEYKAVVEASRATHTGAAGRCCKRPAPSTRPTSSTGSAFCSTTSPRARAFPRWSAAIKRRAAAGAVQAFSIDDSQTTEIDDALSVQGLGTGTVVLGIHIAAPGLAIQPGSALDQLARHRLSTVYMPGYKITMLPDEVVQIYTLDEGRDCPAVSLYVTLDEATLEIQAPKRAGARADRANLRHDQLDHIVTENGWKTRGF